MKRSVFVYVAQTNELDGIAANKLWLVFRCLVLAYLTDKSEVAAL